MAKVIKMTEQDLVKLVKRVLQEQTTQGLVPASVNNVQNLAAKAKELILGGPGASQSKFASLVKLCANRRGAMTVGSNKKADMIRNAIMGLGTDEAGVFKAFRSITSFDEFCSVSNSYKDSYGQDLYGDLDKDFDMENEWAEIMRPIRDLVTRAKGSAPTGGGPAPVVAKKKGQGPAGVTSSIPQRPAVRPTTKPAVAPQRPAVRQTGIDLQSKNRNMNF